MFTDNSEENIPEETASNADATVHSAQEDNQNYIFITERPFNYFSITERPFNYFSRPIEFIKGNEDTTEVTHYFKETVLKRQKEQRTKKTTKWFREKYL